MEIQHPTPSHRSETIAVTLGTHNQRLTMAVIRTPLLPIDTLIHRLHQSIRHTPSAKLRAPQSVISVVNPSFGQPARAASDAPLRPHFGEGCILKWILPLSDNGGRNSCPMCRARVFELTAHTAYSESQQFFRTALLVPVFVVCHWQYILSLGQYASPLASIDMHGEYNRQSCGCKTLSLILRNKSSSTA